VPPSTPPMPKVWSVEEANTLLPDLTFRIGRQMVLLAEIEDGFRRLQGSAVPIDEDLGAREEDPPDVVSLKAGLRDRLDRFRAGWREVEGLGVVVKDPRIGLVDFYGQLEGEIVFLCWQYGEPSVAYWHTLDGGFAGRQPLDAASGPRMLN
jgi:hypothetical protein